MTTMTRQRMGYLEALAAHGGAIEDESGLATTKLREAVPLEERQSADTAKKTLKSMEQAGLIVRDVSGRRVRSISLTEAGWEAFREQAEGVAMPQPAGGRAQKVERIGVALSGPPGPEENYAPLLAAMVQSLAVTRAVLAEWREEEHLPGRPYLEAALTAYAGTCRALIDVLGHEPSDYPEVPGLTMEEIFRTWPPTRRERATQ